jgi:hypothetical protein
MHGSQNIARVPDIGDDQFLTDFVNRLRFADQMSDLIVILVIARNGFMEGRGIGRDPSQSFFGHASV